MARASTLVSSIVGPLAQVLMITLPIPEVTYFQV